MYVKCKILIIFSTNFCLYEDLSIKELKHLADAREVIEVNFANTHSRKGF